MSEQLLFLPSDKVPSPAKDPLVEEVEKICKEAALECARTLVDMAMGKIKFEASQRVACLNVIALAYGKMFVVGRPAKERDAKEELSYSQLMKALKE